MHYSLFGRGDTWRLTWSTVKNLSEMFNTQPRLLSSVSCIDTNMTRDLLFLQKDSFYAVDFTGFKGINSPVPLASPYKLRVSVLDHEIERVFEPLFDIFFHSNNITQFKVFSQDLYNDIVMRINPLYTKVTRFTNSMQFTIYLYPGVPENDGLMPDVDHARVLIDQINTKLSSMNVAVGFHPPVDVPIEGYVSGRIDQIPDAFGRMTYISEQDLQMPIHYDIYKKLNNKFHKFVESMWSPF